ncbi:hypothetical protein ACFVAQ_23350 [Streptomyces sp. NPDC057651]
MAKWATTTVNDLARHTSHTPQRIIDQHETDIIAAWQDLTWHKCRS